MPLEIDVENNVVHYATSIGIENLKLNLQGNRGWPDRQFLYRGESFFIEFKRPGEKPTSLQFWRIRWLREQGFRVIWTDNVTEGKEALKRWKTGRDLQISQLGLTI